MSKNLKLHNNDYYDYIKFLSSGNTYFILISKRILFRSIMPIWIYLFGLFLIQNRIFFGMAVLPCLILVSVFLYFAFPLWNVCNISSKAYVVFHVSVIILLKLLSVPITFLLEELWILCF